MSGIHQMFVGASSDAGSPVSFSGVALQSSTFSSTAQASLTWATSGALNAAGVGSFSWTGPNAWFTPGVPGITYYIKFTLVGDAWDAGLVAGTVYALTSTRSLQWTQTFIGIKQGTVTASIYTDAGGTALVATEVFDFNVEQA